MLAYQDIWKDASTVNVVGGEVVGVMPLLVTRDWYGVAHCATVLEAEAIAERLGVEYRVQ